MTIMEREQRSVEKAVARSLLKTRLEKGSIREIAMSLDKITANVLTDNLGIGAYNLLQQIGAQIPKKIPQEALKTLVRSLNAKAEKTRNLSKKTFMLLSSNTILTVVDSFFIDGKDDLQDRDDMVQEAFLRLGEEISSINPNYYIAGQVNRKVKIAISNYLAKKDNVPTGFTIGPKIRRMITTAVDEKILYQDFKRKDRQAFIAELNSKTGINWYKLHLYLEDKLSRATFNDKKANSIIDDTFDPSVLDEMWQTLQDMLPELSDREKRILGKYGLLTEKSSNQKTKKTLTPRDQMSGIEKRLIRKIRFRYKS